jgi:pantoate--beta-alanine ligase
MKIFHTIKDIKQELRTHKAKNLKIGFVPTMGAIHEGHLSLIRQIKQRCDIVVVSIFVNEKQFNNQQDYLRYPSDIKSDIKKLKADEVDILFNPDSSQMYGNNFSTTISVKDLTYSLCGKSRKGHFDGVALVVTKLFNIINPDISIFGEKDFQQLQIIRRLVDNLNIDVQIISSKIIRKKDGLAISSRNLRLDEDSQKAAHEIYQNLLQIKQEIISNNIGGNASDLYQILSKAKKRIEHSGLGKIDYLEVCDEESLRILESYNSAIKSRLFIAIYINQIRLIDNIQL